ncbi:MAG: SAM-dependent methyltransferase [Candidatus Omnitrophota bacterium]
MNIKNIPCSFRDPSGFLFLEDNILYRQVNGSYKEDYDYLMSSGLYKALTDAGLLIPHEEADRKHIGSDKAYKVIRPEKIPFISYPYEWCFSQLKEAALATLKIQKISLQFGMSLKDCSAYNMQFIENKPVLIDTLSFEKYRDKEPWAPYRQFCQHFLAPLALMSYKDVRLNQLLRIYIDGVPLDLASSLLPFYTFLNFPILSHIHLHSKSQKYFSDKTIKMKQYSMSRLSLLGLIDSLESIVGKLRWQVKQSEWIDYYEDTNYSLEALEQKKEIVSAFLDEVKPGVVWDLGGNIGLFSRIAGNKGIYSISFDMDPCVIEKSYKECLKNREKNILPLIIDLTNPSPSIGWENKERMSLIERGPVDLALALALVHHLAIGNNLPFSKIAEFFSNICKALIIEFIPKSDSQVQRLLSSREDIFLDYTKEHFEGEFRKYFDIENSVKIKSSERVLYLMTKLGPKT